MKQVYFLSGLPRSGSTVLAAILNQNPSVYVTPTSPLLDQLISNQNIWHSLQTVKANPVPDQLTNITRKMIDGIWSHRKEPIILDKNRGWGKNMPASTILFEKPIKMIATTRDLPSIMASWLTLLHKNPNSYMRKNLADKYVEYSDQNMMAEMWFNMVKDCMEALLQAKKDASDRLFLIPYDELVSNPQEVIEGVTHFLNLPAFNYDFNSIHNDTQDDDLAAWGLVGMHSIRSKLEKTCKSPIEILGESLYNIFLGLEKNYE